MQKRNFLNKNNLDTKFFFLFIFCIIFITGEYYYLTLEEYIPLKEYGYDISHSYINSIKNLKIYHDFSSSKGSMSFNIEKESLMNKTNGFNIRLPYIKDKESIEIIKIIKNHSTKYTDWTITNHSDNKNNISLIILGDTISFNETAKYILNYTMEITPNSIISFSHSNLQGTIRLEGKSPTIYFNLGKNYLCQRNCIELKQNMELFYKSTNKEIFLKPIIDNYQDSSFNYHSVKLNVIKDIRAKQSLSIGLIVGSFFAILIVIKEIFETLNLPNFKINRQLRAFLSKTVQTRTRQV